MNIQIDKPENTDKIIDSLRPYFRCYYLKHGKPVNKDFLKNFQIVYIENNGDFDWMLKNSEILTRRYAPFILKAAVNEWKKYRFETYPHKTYIENHKVTAGKVERCDTVKLGDMHKYSREGANKRGNSSRLTQSFHFFMFEPIFSPVNALNQPI